MNVKLTDRDIAVILSVYTYRYLSASQIERLHFPSKRTAWRRIQTLLELGCLKSFTVPTVAERLFCLDKKGAELIAIELHEDLEDLDWHKQTRAPKDYFFLKHFMAINDFRILLTSACNAQPIKLLGFIPEYIGEQKQGFVKKYIRDVVDDLSHTPDGVFALEKDGKPALFFLEIDRGTEIVGDAQKGLLKAIVFYLHYWDKGGYTRYNKDFEREFGAFRLLLVVPSQARLNHIRQEAGKLTILQEVAKRFLWGTVDSWLRAETVFDPIWQSMDATDQTAYQIS